MKNPIFFLGVFFVMSCCGCEGRYFDVENPDVGRFVRELRNGTYDQYHYGENGERLWTLMPEFNERQIPELIDFAEDTSLVCPCDRFPVNPISSIPPYRVVEGKSCMMMGEYLLWCAEGTIRNECPSLTPVLVESGKDPDYRLSGKEILEARELYEDWWNEYRKIGETGKLPLNGSIYRWR
ncbi:MAG: DUF4943 domain-containing protein [Bacteroidales bacterium]|jgi:hypothetical protein|nr:DUF4943 domain-containing protein [Bacteroidales bacterium]MCI2121831.1 DUF4943 domain-containing protein [Bacteroidales bacterium]MCI2146062.1 DUF4943 domain-containing protein [Bacteroidales bacterium]